MTILGISGGLHLAHEESPGDTHDASAVLIVEGQVVSAIEEERLNRIKHTDKFPVQAINFVLEQNNLRLEDVDEICYYSIQNYYFEGENAIPMAEKLQALFYDAFGCRIDLNKFYFVYHHLAHAVSTFYMSGFERSLVLTIDGTGDGISGMILNGEGKNLERLNSFSNENSLGIYYLNVIYILGYKQFDEYKVMGLAPYGNPATYRDLFKTFYALLPEGEYRIDLKQVKKTYLLTPRRKEGEPFSQVHKDIAAALQESVEEIVMHVLKYYQKKYNHSRLCLAGGVAHNCSLNGKILYSGLFAEVFVQPASHDAGCALGSALYRYHELNPRTNYETLGHLYWGTPVAEKDSLLSVLERWGSFIRYEQVEQIEKKAAQLLANGAVIGWVQGKSEFGPRALGNRSIVADPRPAENKDIINAMVKKREAYRPFAPCVLEEYGEDYFEIPFKNKRQLFSYMIFVVKVKPDQQKLLGAVTHVDGTARIQTVSQGINPRCWQLIDEFRKITGVPILLNTSFNNNAEPIVDSASDALVCFLTTQLNYLVMGDYLIMKKEVESADYLQMALSLPVHNVLSHSRRFMSPHGWQQFYEIKNNFANGYGSVLSPGLFHILNNCNGQKTLGELIKTHGPDSAESEQRKIMLKEILTLWEKRFIRLSPPA